jgi:hypothetical protein
VTIDQQRDIGEATTMHEYLMMAEMLMTAVNTRRRHFANANCYVDAHWMFPFAFNYSKVRTPLTEQLQHPP